MLSGGWLSELTLRRVTRLAKERFIEGIFDPDVQGKLRDLWPGTLKDALDEA